MYILSVLVYFILCRVDTFAPVKKVTIWWTIQINWWAELTLYLSVKQEEVGNYSYNCGVGVGNYSYNCAGRVAGHYSYCGEGVGSYSYNCGRGWGKPLFETLSMWTLDFQKWAKWQWQKVLLIFINGRSGMPLCSFQSLNFKSGQSDSGKKSTALSNCLYFPHELTTNFQLYFI